MKKYLFTIPLVLFLMAALPVAATAQHAQVYVIHGIPGADLGLDPTLPVDVSVNGACLLNAFTFGEIVGPLGLEEGTYNIKISVADPANPCGNAPVIEADVPIYARQNVTIIAHLSDEGAPTASVFQNDASPIQNAKTRVTIHHTAWAPDVDAWLERATEGKAPLQARVEKFINGDKASFEINTKNWKLYLSPWRSGIIAFKKSFRPFVANNAILVYVVGSVQNGTLTVLKLRIKGLGKSL